MKCRIIKVFVCAFALFAVPAWSKQPDFLPGCAAPRAAVTFGTGYLQFLLRIYPEIREVLRTGEEVSWPSGALKSEVPLTRQRVQELMDLVFDEASPVSKEVAKYVEDLGGVQSPEIWNKYFLAYDKYFGFSSGYMELLWHAMTVGEHVENPGKGLKILDLGAGTGNFSAAALRFFQGSTLTAIDQSTVGLGIAKKKVAQIGKTESFKIINDNLLNVNLPDGEFSLIFLNNVFYTFSPENRKVGAAKIFRALKPGGRVFFSDPNPKIQLSENELKSFLTRSALDAYDNGSLANEAEFVFGAKVNQITLVGKTSRFLTLDQKFAAMKEVGFEIVASKTAYYEQVDCLELRKPL